MLMLEEDQDRGEVERLKYFLNRLRIFILNYTGLAEISSFIRKYNFTSTM